MGRLLFSALIALVISNLQAFAEGALACGQYPNTLGHNCVVTFDHNSRKDAVEAAVKACRSTDFYLTCKVQSVFAKSCLAHAITGRGGNGWAGGDTAAEAERAAIGECRKGSPGYSCRITLSACDYISEADIALQLAEQQEEERRREQQRVRQEEEEEARRQALAREKERTITAPSRRYCKAISFEMECRSTDHCAWNSQGCIDRSEISSAETPPKRAEAPTVPAAPTIAQSTQPTIDPVFVAIAAGVALLLVVFAIRSRTSTGNASGSAPSIGGASLASLFSIIFGNQPAPVVPKQPTPHEKKLAQAHFRTARRVYESEKQHDIKYEFQATHHLYQAAKELAKAHALDPTATILINPGTPDEFPISLDYYAAMLCAEEAGFYKGMAKSMRMKGRLGDPEYHMSPKKWEKENTKKQREYASKARISIDHTLELCPGKLGFLQRAIEVYAEYNHAFYQEPRRQLKKEYDALVKQALEIDPYNDETLELVR